MHRFKPICRRKAIVAIIALILQVLLPLLQPTMAAEAMTGQGLRHCSMAQKSADHSKAGPQKSTTTCPICMAMHLQAHGFVSPHDVVLAIIERVAIPVMPPQDSALVTPPYPAHAQPRAPPTLA